MKIKVIKNPVCKSIVLGWVSNIIRGYGIYNFSYPNSSERNILSSKSRDTGFKICLKRK